MCFLRVPLARLLQTWPWEAPFSSPRKASSLPSNCREPRHKSNDVSRGWGSTVSAHAIPFGIAVMQRLSEKVQKMLHEVIAWREKQEAFRHFMYPPNIKTKAPARQAGIFLCLPSVTFPL